MRICPFGPIRGSNNHQSKPKTARTLNTDVAKKISPICPDFSPKSTPSLAVFRRALPLLAMAPPRRALLALAALLLFSLYLTSTAFQSDELVLNDDEEFEGVGARPSAPSPPVAPAVSSSRRRSADSASPGAGEPNALQFTLEHNLGGGKGFTPAGIFSARLKTSAHGTQVRLCFALLWLFR
jgi:hypothetical protein